MADPTSLDSALYRMKAYSALLIDDPEKKAIGLDIAVLCGWIEHARPFLGDISIDVPGVLQELYGNRKKAPASELGESELGESYQQLNQQANERYQSALLQQRSQQQQQNLFDRIASAEAPGEEPVEDPKPAV